jgi:hypothetical protein
MLAATTLRYVVKDGACVARDIQQVTITPKQSY